MAQRLVDSLVMSLQRAAASASYGFVNYRHPLRSNLLKTSRSAYTAIPTVTTPLECAELCQALLACEKVPGDMAEAGVYLGGTARMMLATSASKKIHLFDTFEGLPSAEGTFSKGEYAGSIDSVRRNLAEFAPRLEFHPGFFPASTAGLDGLRFSFVHLDLDLYQSTFDALEWFWPRLNSGGILLSHDYPFAEGVVRAFREFFDPRPEPFLPLSGCQCLAIKP